MLLSVLVLVAVMVVTLQISAEARGPEPAIIIPAGVIASVALGWFGYRLQRLKPR